MSPLIINQHNSDHTLSILILTLTHLKMLGSSLLVQRTHVNLFCSAIASLQTNRQALLCKGPSPKWPLSNFNFQLLMSTYTPKILEV